MPKSKLRTKLKKKSVIKKQTVKRSQKSNLLSLLTLVLAIIAIGSYVTYKNLVRPIGINEVGSSNLVTCSQGFTDNFDNVDYLSRYKIDDPTGTKIENGLATFTSSAGSRIRSQIFNGNFVTILTISDSNSTSAIPVMVVRYLDDPNIDSIGVKIKYDKTIGKIQSFRVTSPDGKTGIFDLEKSLPIETSKQPSAYKVERQGSTFLVYFKTTNSDFQLIGAYDNLTTENVSIRFGADNSEKTVFDSFSISCLPSPKPPTPNNPRSTCNPDGKSVRLMWDGVDSANSYKVRVDDKAGKVTPFDGISKTEYIANISPNQTYSWWGHATKDGIDSAETPRLEFRCTPTTAPTPTPKPTVKPTVVPTATPTITPTATPTNSTYIAPTTTQAQKFDLPVEPVSTPLPTKSTNPISRFFSWLASLFE